MRYVPPVLVLAALLVAIGLLCAAGWRRRARRTADLPAPAALSAPAGADGAGEGADGVYVATTLAERPLERVTAHGLGARSRVHVVRAPDGTWRLERQGAPSFLIPAPDVREVTTAPGMAGKWIGGDGLLVVRWQLGERLLDTGVRLEDRTAHDRLLALGRKDQP